MKKQERFEHEPPTSSSSSPSPANPEAPSCQSLVRISPGCSSANRRRTRRVSPPPRCSLPPPESASWFPGEDDEEKERGQRSVTPTTAQTAGMVNETTTGPFLLGVDSHQWERVLLWGRSGKAFVFEGLSDFEASQRFSACLRVKPTGAEEAVIHRQTMKTCIPPPHPTPHPSSHMLDVNNCRMGRGGGFLVVHYPLDWYFKSITP